MDWGRFVAKPFVANPLVDKPFVANPFVGNPGSGWAEESWLGFLFCGLPATSQRAVYTLPKEGFVDVDGGIAIG